MTRLFTHILPILLLLEIIGLVFFSLVMQAFGLTITPSDYIVFITVPFGILLLSMTIGFFAYRTKIKTYK